MNQHRRPIWFAVLATAMSVPLILALLSTLAIHLVGSFVHFKGWGALTGLVAFILPYSYVAMLVFALPYILWLRARGELTRPNICSGTVVASLLAVPVYSSLVAPQFEVSGAIPLLAASLGLLSGICFCVAAGITFRSSRRAAHAA
jgi:hypothetical protein